MKNFRGNAALLTTAIIWGFAFVAQSVAMDYISPFTFLASRSILGGLVLLLYLLVRNRIHPHHYGKQERRQLLLGGLCCGTVLCIASSLQQFGIVYTTVGKAGFITAMYVLIVPILSVLMRKKIQKKIWLCVSIALVGLYLLSMNGSFSLSRGDSFCALCAVGFAIQIMLVDHFSPKVDCVALSCVQFFVSGAVASVLMAAFEQPNLQAVGLAWKSIAYAGILSCGVAYTLQIVGQKYTEPTTATLLMSLESVFSVVGGILLLRQIPTAREAIGCLLMFAAVVYAQIPSKSLETKVPEGELSQ